MAVKYFDKEQNKWVIFPGTVGAPGKSAYQLATEMGYKGSFEEYTHALYYIPECVSKIENADEAPVNGSKNLVLSNGVYNSVKKVSDDLGTFKTNVSNTYVTKTELENKGYLTDKECVTHTELTNELKPYALKTEIPTNNNELENGAGYLTGITSAQVVAALGYTPYNSTNPNSYITVAALQPYAKITDIPSLTGYATQAWVKSQKYLTQHQDISKLASKDEVTTALTNAKNYTNTEIGKLSSVYETKGTAQNLINGLNIGNYVSKTELTEELKPYLKNVPDEYITEEELNKMQYATKADIDEIEALIGSMASGLKKASVNGGPGYTTVGGSYNLSNLGYTEDNPFGVIIVSHGTSVSFTGAHMQSTLDESDGSYDVYCIMYVNKMFLVNMCVYN